MFPFLHGIYGSGAVRTYATILRDDFGASEVWPLVNIPSGTAIPAVVNSARNGVLQGWGLQNAAGPVTGTLAPYSDGANDYGNILTSGGGVGLANIFNPSVGSYFLWLKATSWDGTKLALTIRPDGTNSIDIYHSSANLTFRRRAQTIAHATGSTTSWFATGMSWDTGADELKAFYGLVGGVMTQVGSTATSLPTWTGSTPNNGIIGANTITPLNVFNGHIAYCAVKFGSIWTPTDFANMHAAASTAGAD